MRISVLIILSLAINLALAAVLFQKKSSPANGASATAKNPGSITTPENASVANTRAIPGENAGAPLSAKISWRDLQTEDLKDYIRRLRAVDCPELTIQDLILAEVNRRYGAKQRAIWLDDPDVLRQMDYWRPYQRKRDPEAQKKSRERMKLMQSWQKEKTALIVELFGFDVEKQRMQQEGYDSENWGWNPRGDLAFLPEAKREAVGKYLEDFYDKEQELWSSGNHGPEERLKSKQLEQQKLAGLAQFLTPQEVREYELRNSQMADQISSDLHGVDLSREQYEALFDTRKKYGDSIFNYGDAGNDEAARKQIEQNKKDMMAEIASKLGDEKTAELDRAQDYTYQQLVSLSRHNDLPPDTAPKIYDYKQSAEKAVEALNANQDLTPEQRQAALSQIRTETEASLKATLGDKLFKRYQSNGGYWINSLAPSAPKTPTVISR